MNTASAKAGSTGQLPLLTVIAGPTASGKSALAVELAEALGTEIISADSRQVYKDIPIVTAMPGGEDLRSVPHHLVGMLPLDAYYSAARFEEDALSLLPGIFERGGGHAVVAGGSMLYIDALLGTLDDLPTVPVEIREGLAAEIARRNNLEGGGGDRWVKAELQRLDPQYWEEVDRNNLKRIIHAVEIIRTSARTYTELRTGNAKPRPFRVLKLMLERTREELFDRINSRVDDMDRRGLESEARSVEHLRHLNSTNTVGLKEMFAWFDGRLTRAEAISRIKKNTRVYAKKQMAWWKRDPSWLRIPADTRITDILPLITKS